MTAPQQQATRTVALETTLLAHGLPRDRGLFFARELETIIEAEGATPATIGVLRGVPAIGMHESELAELLGEQRLPKVNTSNLGLVMHQKRSAATTVSATMELAAQAGIQMFATGGIGGVHRNYDIHLDISADLVALTRFPVAVVASGVKGILDVCATREALESLGVPVIGFGCDAFPAFYVRESSAQVDLRIDSIDELAQCISAELARTQRGLLICHPVPTEHAITEEVFETWHRAAIETIESSGHSMGTLGRDATPKVLAELRRLSNGKLLETNLALVRSNAKLAAQIATRLASK